MDSASNWGNSSTVKSEIWGNSSSVLGSSNSGSTGSFAQNSDRSSSSSSSSGNPGTAWSCSGAKIPQVATNSNMMWPSSEISSKQDVGKWGMGLSGAGGGGSGSQSGQNDPDSWRSGGANCWTTSDEKNDISGWGSPNRSPVPHAGTDGRGSKAVQNDDQIGGWPADSRSNNGYLQPDPRQASGSWSETATDRSKQSQWGAAGNSSLGSASGAWSRGNPIMQPSQSVPTMGNPQSQQGAPNSWAQAVTNKSGQSAAGSGSCGAAAGAAAPDDSKASSLRRSQEELIAQAINSNDGWGKIAIRQDTAWVIEDTMIEQRKAPSAQDATNEETASQLSRQMMTGTAIWESSKAASAAAASRSAEKSAEDRSAWSGTLVEKTNVVVASNPANGPNPAMAVGSNPASAFRPPMDKPSTNSWPPGQSDKPTGWGTGSTSSEGSWEGPKKEDDRVWDLEINKGSKTETGVWDRPLRRSSSSGSWTGDEIENVGWGDDKPRQPPEVDDGTSVWGDPGNQNRPQNWKHSNKPPAGSSQLLGQRMRPDERGDGFFGAPPPSINLKPAAFGEQMENSVGPWNPSIPPPKPDSGGWGDGHWPNVTGPRPQKSASMSGAWDINDWMSGSNRRNDFPMSGISGGKGPTPQRSVILQQLLSMGFRKEDAQNALISNNMNLESALSELLTSRLRPDPEVADHQRGRLLRPSDDLTSDSSLDTNSLLFGLPALGQLNNSPFNIAGGGGPNPQQALANQLRPGGPTSLQQAFGSSLGNQPSALPDFTTLLQRTNQVMNNSVLTPPHQQQQQLMQQLMQNVQAAIQLGLLPSNLMKPQMLMNNNFVVNVQRLLQLYEMHQKLSEQCQLIQRQHQGSVLPSTTQQRLVEITITIVGLQQQIDQVKQQIIQLSTMPTSISSLPPVDQLLKGLQVKDDGTAASRLMSQWKIDSDTDIKSVQHSTSLDMPITESTWMSSASSSSSWSGSAAVAAAAVEDSASIGSGGIAANGASLDAKAQSTVGINLTSTLSSAITTISESAVASSSSSAAPASALDIEEFVPGKPWQGPSTKNVEDDPYITPGSVTRNSLSTINDIQVMNILGKNNASGGGESRSSSSLGRPGLSQSLQSPAPHSNAWLSEPPPLLSVDPWGRNPALPPGLHIQNKPQWQYNRSVSWTPGDRSEYTSVMNNWSTAPSNWLLLRNLPPQVDSGTLHTLCMQHGPVLKFFPNVSRSIALVGYGKVEDAIKAQRSLHSCKFGNTQLAVDFITENDVGHLLEANGRGAAPQPNSFVRPPMPSLGSNYSGLHQGQLNRPELVSQWSGGTAGGVGLGGANSWNAMSTGGNSWLPGFEDHGAAFLPGDLLGGQ